MPDFSAVAVALCLVSGPSPCTEIFFAGQCLPLLQEKTARLCLQSCHLSRARLLGVALTGVMWGVGGGVCRSPSPSASSSVCLTGGQLPRVSSGVWLGCRRCGSSDVSNDKAPSDTLLFAFCMRWESFTTTSWVHVDETVSPYIIILYCGGKGNTEQSALHLQLRWLHFSLWGYL